MLNTVVFPVAGLGTRMLPATRAVPKELLPVVDRPLIHYAVDEALAAGARRLVFVAGRNESALKSYFSGVSLPDQARCIYVRQPRALGLGHAVLCAREVVEDDSFGLILPDDLIIAPAEPALLQMARYHDRSGASVIGVEAVPREDTARYGIAEIDWLEDSRAGRISSLVEKPDPEEAPSNLAVVGRYILHRCVFDILEHTPPGQNNEIQLTDALAEMLSERAVHAWRFSGQRHDCGGFAGFLRATVEIGCRHPDIGDEFAAWLRRRVTGRNS
ncbi:MAG TPA: UTP--glucose-1-phosphate uridylyltransferase [Wenzhouxiangella sp.]|nr:UTP--glucose-1-phosphate uridylyltransferase [Wenzhouxiangella sp.]